MAYFELKIADNACINHQKRTLLTPFFINLLLIEAKSFPQCPKFASNFLRFCEEPIKLMKMLPEHNNTILMSVCSINKSLWIKIVKTYIEWITEHLTWNISSSFAFLLASLLCLTTLKAIFGVQWDDFYNSVSEISFPI